MKLIFLVGTNGKTSTSYILKSIFEQTGKKVGVIGTNGVMLGDSTQPTLLTTPDPIELHGIFAEMKRQCVEFVIMEASAHAIALRKLEGLQADVTAFTNFSQDHLDFFKTMQAYRDTKRSFFNEKHTKVAVVNADDDLGLDILADNKIPILTFGYDNPSDIFAMDYSENEMGISYTINLYDEIGRVHYPLCGKFNVYNTMCASVVARVFGIKLSSIAQGIAKIRGIEGRNQTVYRSDGCRIVVDFAHTPDGVKNMLEYLASTTKGNLYVVFGCGGNRDRFKRPLMGKIVSKYAYFSLITNDNPRFEAPASIVSDIICGFEGEYKIIYDRREAIFEALKMAKSNDTVAVIGKGAESFQEISGKRISYNDMDVIRQLI